MNLSNFQIRKTIQSKEVLCVFSLLLLIGLYPKSSWAMAKRPPVEVVKAQNEVPVPTSGTLAWKLSELVDEALKENPELYAYRERWKAAKARVWKAISWDDTMMGADFEGIPRGQAAADRASNIEWMVSQKIPFPGKKFLKGRVASKEAKMALEDYKAKRQEIINEVKKAYFDYFFKEHEIMLHGETQRILERLAKSAESRYATGKLPYYEVLKAHTELATMTNEIAKHYQERDTAMARLNALIGREADEPLQIAVAVPDRNFTYTKEELMKLALKNRPELQAMRYGLEAAKTDSKAAWLDLAPDGQFRIEARQFAGEGRVREYDQFFGFEVPILSLLGRVGQIKEKRAEKRAAEGAWENMKNMVLYEVQKAWAEFESNERTVKLYEMSVVPQAESAFRSILSDYESGKATFSSVMDAQKAVTEFHHHYFESIVMREQSFSDLERMVGMSLEGGLMS